MMGQVKLLLTTTTFVTVVLVGVLTALILMYFFANVPRKTMFKDLSPCLSCERPGWSFWFLTVAWVSFGC